MKKLLMIALLAITSMSAKAQIRVMNITTDANVCGDVYITLHTDVGKDWFVQLPPNSTTGFLTSWPSGWIGGVAPIPPFNFTTADITMDPTCSSASWTSVNCASNQDGITGVNVLAGGLFSGPLHPIPNGWCFEYSNNCGSCSPGSWNSIKVDGTWYHDGMTGDEWTMMIEGH